MNHNNRRNNNNRRFKNNNNNKRRFGGGNNSFDDESQNISMQQRKNFANKRDQYLVKAKDALSAGDRVEAESFYQHADHCFRMMNLGLKDGSRFDPQRMMIVNDNHVQNEAGEGAESEAPQGQHEQGENPTSEPQAETAQGEVQDGQLQQQRHQNRNQQRHQNRRPRENRDYGNQQNAEAPNDISSLPFLQAPIEAPVEIAEEPKAAE